ncbi:Prp18-domain-containing protein [Piedraia hortae CBS 480.64]|uniref:Pre-mRNA-splicing factor 18 n=1 Tax=Piedraia hortae CBS 480.64 TaxID=1314780 RepID=A0A6A7C7E7_9PEZI|nr:Prp18-domain-containing protein [Piedraia hortae CBS 480.64]
MDFASLMKEQIAAAAPSDKRKSTKRSELEAQREAEYRQEQEAKERARQDRLDKKRRAEGEEEAKQAERQAKRKRMAEESRRVAEEEAFEAENKRRKRIGLPELERKKEDSPLPEGEEDIADDELQDRLKALDEPRRLFGESHLQRLRRYRAVATPVPAKMTDGPIPTSLELVEEKDMKVPERVPIDPKDRFFLRRQIASYFDMLLLEWQLALARRPQDVKDSAPGKQAHGYFEQARDSLVPLFRKLEDDKLAEELFNAINEIVHLAQLRKYVSANDAYLRVSIGKAAWPIGVTMVGIHERSSREKLHERERNKAGTAHIMSDDTTRKMLQGIKRCLSFAQTRWPPDEAWQMMG